MSNAGSTPNLGAHGHTQPIQAGGVPPSQRLTESAAVIIVLIVACIGGGLMFMVNPTVPTAAAVSIALALLAGSVMKTQENHFSRVSIFGVPRYIKFNGLSLVPVFAMSADQNVSLKQHTTYSIVDEKGKEKKETWLKLQTSDGEIEVRWSLRWFADPTIPDHHGQPCMFLAHGGTPRDNAATIHDGYRNAVTAKITTIVGSIGTESLVGQKDAIDLWMNSEIILEVPAHVWHADNGCDDPACNLGVHVIGDPKVDNPRLLQFYVDHRKWVVHLLEEQRATPDSHSAIENQFGTQGVQIDVAVRMPAELAEYRKQKLQSEQSEKVGPAFWRFVDDAIHRGVDKDTAYRNALSIYYPERTNVQTMVVDGLKGSGETGGLAGALAVGQTVGNAGVSHHQPSGKKDRNK